MAKAVGAIVSVGAAIATGGTSLLLNLAAALSVAGAITGNKTLGLLGGVAGIASAAGGFLTAAQAATEGGAEATSLASGAAVEGADGISQGVVQGADTAGQAVDAVANAAGGGQGANLLGPTNVFGSSAPSALDNFAGTGSNVTGLDPTAAQSFASNPGAFSGATANAPDLPGAAVPSNPAEANLQSQSTINPQSALTPSATPAAQVNPANAPLSATSPAQQLNAPVGPDTTPSRYDVADVTDSVGSTAGAQPQGIVDRILNSGLDFMKGDQAKSALIKVGGEALASGFRRNPNAELVDLYRLKNEQDMAERQRQITNANNVSGVTVPIAPNPGARLYPNGAFQPVGILQRNFRSA